MTKTEKIIKELEKNPLAKTSYIMDLVGCGQWVIYKVRSKLGIKNPDRQLQIWTEEMDHWLVGMRDNGGLSFTEIGVEMGLAKSTVRNRYTRIQGKSVQEIGYKPKLKAKFAWTPGPIVRYLPVFGR